MGEKKRIQDRDLDFGLSHINMEIILEKKEEKREKWKCLVNMKKIKILCFLGQRINVLEKGGRGQILLRGVPYEAREVDIVPVKTQIFSGHEQRQFN